MSFSYPDLPEDADLKEVIRENNKMRRELESYLAVYQPRDDWKDYPSAPVTGMVKTGIYPNGYGGPTSGWPGIFTYNAVTSKFIGQGRSVGIPPDGVGSIYTKGSPYTTVAGDWKPIGSNPNLWLLLGNNTVTLFGAASGYQLGLYAFNGTVTINWAGGNTFVLRAGEIIVFTYNIFTSYVPLAQ